MFMFRQRDHGSIAALAAIAAGEVPPPASPDYHEFCVNIAGAVQLTTRRHHLRHLQVLAWFEAMEHRSMINACIWGLGPAWLHLVAKYPATKKVQKRVFFCVYVLLKYAIKPVESRQIDSGNEIHA